MRIQTRLFLGTAVLVLALMGLQWWLYSRQLRSIEQDLTDVATTVGRGMLTAENVIFGRSASHNDGFVWVDGDSVAEVTEDQEDGPAAMEKAAVRIVKIPISKTAAGEQHLVDGEVIHDVSVDGEAEHKIEWVVSTTDGETEGQQVVHRVIRRIGPDGKIVEETQKLEVGVEPGERSRDRILVVKDKDKDLHRISIPTSPAVERVQGTMREGAAVGGLLLVVGLFASALLSSRLTSPLRSLADGAEALGRGDLGIQVPVSASGEIGELQGAFNSMSSRLAELEGEREEWLKREHLAQLGDLSRGLAHTLRNPLHTLGLAVEELAEGEGDRRSLVATSRTQIRRIDRWLRSFLALGAEESAHAESVDLAEIVDAVVLETVQEGSRVSVDSVEGEVRTRVVAGAIRAALANLVENAVEVSPEDTAVTVELEREGGTAVIRVIDLGPGLPNEVRERLFSPHVTTKVGGSGMGLFLARQLIVGMHGGELTIQDGAEGGTIATVELPLEDQVGRPREVDNG